uniref:DNA-directed RNA polymerase subunit beta'' n=1 Tax=Licmophora sp. TaxID=2115823 RepID=A0A2U9NNY0_9STRA|nr:RNA polymerase beta' subunit [Licmophora sp.]
MKNYIYQNTLIGKKQLRQILGWSFTNYDSMQACTLADELKYVGFKYATQAGISISIEDLRVPFIKTLLLEKSNQEIINSEKIYLKGKITDVERFQKIIDTWSLTSESLKEQVINYFKNYDPLNSVYIMAFSGARGNLSQVRQLVGMRGLMSDPSGEIMNLPIKKNFREGLTITDYLMSGYGARKGIVDTALKTANSGYLTRRLIDVSQDILIREKDCNTAHSVIIKNTNDIDLSKQLLGRILNKSLIEPTTSRIIAKKNTQITPTLIDSIKKKKISHIYIRSPLTCKLYRALCQQCYGWDLATENLVDIGEAIGILAGQSIGEPGTQLTMRTFHTGGIFTSEARQQVISPLNGIIQFSKFLETIVLRTNRGEEVLVTKNSGSVILIPELSTQEIIKIEILRNTILFPKHNQYVQKDTVIGELINTNKQLKREIKPILATTSGEVIIPKLKINNNNSKLLWILSGSLYNSPLNSYINFHSDHKLNKNSFIYRTKILNLDAGQVVYYNSHQSLYQRKIKLKNTVYSLKNSKFSKLITPVGNYNAILKLNTLNYLAYSEIKNSNVYLKINRKNQIAQLLNDAYKTETGGTIYYDWHILNHNIISRMKVYFINKLTDKSLVEVEDNIKLNNSNLSNSSWIKRCSKSIHRTFIWLEEEVHTVNCEQNILLVKAGDFIAKNFEVTPGYFSKTSGLVSITEKNHLVQTITIKSGLVYEGNEFIDQATKLYFPGELIFSNIPVVSPSLCQRIQGRNGGQLLVRSLKLYEYSHFKSTKNILQGQNNIDKSLKLVSNSQVVYQPNQKISTIASLDLVIEDLILDISHLVGHDLEIKLKNKHQHRILEFEANFPINLNNYIPSKLKYKKLQSCILIQPKQFIDRYTTLVYLESLTLSSLEIVKCKINSRDIKQILLISNDDCVILNKKKLPDKTVNHFVLNSTNVNQIGKIIIDNNKFFTIQKGRPYFFPKCKIDNLVNQSNLEYKILANQQKSISIKQNLVLNDFNRLKMSIQIDLNNYWKEKADWKNYSDNVRFSLKAKFSKMFLKKNGKLYSCMIPRFLKQFTIGSQIQQKTFLNLDMLKYKKKEKSKLDNTLLLQSSEIVSNNLITSRLTLVKFFEYPFTKTMKSIGLYSITEDFFEQDLNSVFCQNNQFLENGDTIGLLNLEKEITGDIVQGLPRIEEILEARKKNQKIKRVPNSQKKGLLAQKTSLDQNFEFRKLATPIKENEKINPHKLLKIYFNYYGFLKPLFCDKEKIVRYVRLMNNFEGSYKSFKKVQSFILNSVQTVYQSQGVTINDKHLEVIIKQMTTKVLITDEGDTPLLKREVIDLYHIEYINRIMENEQKCQAYYLPLLFGITRAALNNPSFISAASFQETTRVLTKAAIEGRIDWLRGLKENIIIGHLIPAGTGSRNYKTSFKKPFSLSFSKNVTMSQITL